MKNVPYLRNGKAYELQAWCTERVGLGLGLGLLLGSWRRFASREYLLLTFNSNIAIYRLTAGRVQVMSNGGKWVQSRLMVFIEKLKTGDQTCDNTMVNSANEMPPRLSPHDDSLTLPVSMPDLLQSNT